MRILAVLGLLVSSAVAASAQTWTPEISAHAGVGHVFRWEDRSYGDRLNAGGGVALVRGRWAIEVNADRTLNLEPPLVPCGIADVTCVGEGRDGPLTMHVISLAAQYRFPGRRLQPYVLAGLGLMRSRSAHSRTQVQGPIAVITERESSDRGFGPELGAGLIIPLTTRWSIRPELRWLDAPWTSRENLAVTRLLLDVAYTFRPAP